MKRLMRISGAVCRRLRGPGIPIALCLLLWPYLVAAQDQVVSDAEYEIYEMLLQDMTPVDEFDAFLKSENPDYVMPRLKLLVLSTTTYPDIFDTLIFDDDEIDDEFDWRAFVVNHLSDSIPVEARAQMADDLLKKAETTSTIEDRFSALVSVRVTSKAEIDSIGGDELFGFWGNIRENFGPCAIVRFSRVGFDLAGQYGVLYYSYSSGGLSGAGYRMIVRKKGNTWKICERSMMWIS